jgi:hypothetical protein
MSILQSQYQRFVQIWNGRSLDVDKVPANQVFQCADVPKAFQYQVGIKVYPFGSPDGGVWSSGKKVFEGEARCIDPKGGDSKFGRYEVEFVNNSSKLKKGDYVYFVNTQTNPYGHIGLFEAKVGSSIKVFNQNWSSTYCKFDSIPQEYFARGLRIIFSEESQDSDLTSGERKEIINLINQYRDIFNYPDKHINNVGNKKTQEFVFDVLLALKSVRQNPQLTAKLVEAINQSKTLNKSYHIKNIKERGDSGIVDSFSSMIKAIDDLRST